MTTEIKRPFIAGAILAGGDARRMGGIPKGMLETCDGISVAERLILELGRADINDIAIIANDRGPYARCGVPVIPDIRTGIGPLAGIETALVHFTGRSDAVLFVPCDLPQITADEFRALKQAFRPAETPVVFARTADFFWHPLCAVVHNALATDISGAIDGGKRKVRDIWRLLDAVGVEFAEHSIFFNINSPADMDGWDKMRRGGT